MTKSELTRRLATKQPHLGERDIELAVNLMVGQMTEAVARGERVEIRGFGSFSLHVRAPRIGRNPRTGESVQVTRKCVPHFKPGKEMRERVNVAMIV
jgi:integration host factor subunit beta